MQRTGAAEGDERQPGGIDTPLDRHESHGPLHRRVDHIDDTLGGDAGPVERGASGIDIEPAEVAEGRIRWNAPEHQVGVGDSGLGASASVARGTRIGARAPGPHGEGSARIDAGDRAAAGADGVDVERWQTDREPRRRAPGRRLRRGAQDQAHVGARTAHVEGHGVGEAGGGRGRGRGLHPARRPRQQGATGSSAASPAGTRPPAEVITRTSAATSPMRAI